MSQIETKRATKKLKEAEFAVFRLADSEKNDPKLAKYFGGVVPEYRPLTTVPFSDIVYDDKYGQREIRYIEGYPTIYVDEQIEKKIPDVIVNRARSIEFIDGWLRVHKSNKQLIEYLTICNYNAKNPKRDPSKRTFFEQFDEAKLAANDVVAWDYFKRAVEIADTLSDDEIFPLAKFLGVATANAFTQGDRPIGVIKSDLRKRAIKDPKAFVDAYNNPTVSTAFLIRTALDKNIITLGKVQGQAHWTSTGTLICVVPSDKDPIDVLVDFAYTEKGADFLVAIKSTLK